MNKRTPLICTSLLLIASACGSDTASNAGSSVSQTSDTSSEIEEGAVFPARLGEPAVGYFSIVDLAVRTIEDGAATTYAVEQGGLIKLVGDDGSPGEVMADLTALTDERGEQGLLGLAFSRDGRTAFVNYTDLDGHTTVDRLAVADDGSFDVASRQTIYTLEQPYRNHNGGDLIVSPDGRYLFVFNGDGGSADDPDRYALDASTELGKIVRIDLEASNEDPDSVPPASIWSSGLRNPWRAYLDPITEDLWVADVGQNKWEEINVVSLAESEGASFGWSAFEGTVEFNADQLPIHLNYDEVMPIHTYPHENDDCSISGGAVYRGSGIAVVGTWYVFSDFCSGNVRALCITESRTTCGEVSIGTVASSVAVLPDADGELWVLSLSGELVPLISST